MMSRNENNPMTRSFKSPTRLVGAVVGAACHLVACNISPQPVPPPEPDSISIDTTLLRLEPSDPGVALLVGMPDSVSPGAETVEADNLDAVGGSGQGVVDEDGSFAITVPGSFDDTYRLQARGGLLFSPPVDVQGLGAPGPLGEPGLPFGGCLAVRTPRELVFPPTEVGQVTVEPVELFNDCPFDIMIVSSELQTATPSFIPLAGIPADIIPSGQRWLSGVAFAPEVPGPHRNLVFLALDGLPEPQPPPEPLEPYRVAITLRGAAIEPSP